MLRVALFEMFLAAAVLFAWWKGGEPERMVASCFATGFVATLASYTALPARFASVEVSIAVIDLAMLGVLLTVGLRADRLWVLLVAGLQLDIVAVHALKAIDASILRSVYAITITMWAYPQLVLLIAGVERHRRRLGRHGDDRGWTTR